MKKKKQKVFLPRLSPEEITRLGKGHRHDNSRNLRRQSTRNARNRRSLREFDDQGSLGLLPSLNYPNFACNYLKLL